MSSFSLAERRTEGGRKEDKTAPPSIEEQEQEQIKATPPYPLASEGECGVEAAIDQVCNALAIANGRKRRLFRQAIELERNKGEPPPTTALAMIAAWRKQEASSEQLSVKYGIEKFFGNGYWKRERSWHWNEELLRLRATASVGSYP
jgi:hypothetical protein